MRLLSRIILRLMLRRLAWMKWLPPIARPSPSPDTCQTVRLGLATFAPVAIAAARRGYANLGHSLMERCQEEMVTATRTPARLSFLIILCCICHNCLFYGTQRHEDTKFLFYSIQYFSFVPLCLCVHLLIISSNALTNSSTTKGCPFT